MSEPQEKPQRHRNPRRVLWAIAGLVGTLMSAIIPLFPVRIYYFVGLVVWSAILCVEIDAIRHRRAADRINYVFGGMCILIAVTVLGVGACAAGAAQVLWSTLRPPPAPPPVPAVEWAKEFPERTCRAEVPFRCTVTGGGRLAEDDLRLRLSRDLGSRECAEADVGGLASRRRLDVNTVELSGTLGLNNIFKTAVRPASPVRQPGPRVGARATEVEPPYGRYTLAVEVASLKGPPKKNKTQTLFYYKETFRDRPVAAIIEAPDNWAITSDGELVGQNDLETDRFTPAKLTEPLGHFNGYVAIRVAFTVEPLPKCLAHLAHLFNQAVEISPAELHSTVWGDHNSRTFSAKDMSQDRSVRAGQPGEVNTIVTTVADDISIEPGKKHVAEMAMRPDDDATSVSLRLDGRHVWERRVPKRLRQAPWNLYIRVWHGKVRFHEVSVVQLPPDLAPEAMDVAAGSGAGGGSQ